MPGSNTTPISGYDGRKEREASSPDSTMEDTRTYWQMEYKNAILDETTLNTRVYGNLNEKRYEYPAAGTDDLSTDYSGGAEVVVNAPYGFTAGADAQLNYFKKRSLAVFPWLVSVNEDTASESVFLQESQKLGRLTAVLGGRYDNHSVFGGQANPRVSLVFQAARGTKVSANAGRAFRAPTFEDLYLSLIHI